MLYQQLSTLLTAGIPLVQCCQILLQGQDNLALSHMISSIKRQLEIGKNLSHAMQKYPHHFDEMSCQLIQIGEQTGSLDTSLKRIVQYKEQSLQLTNKIQQAIFYPMIVTSIALIITTIMILCVVPQFAELFQGLHTRIPAATMAIFALSSFLRSYGWVLLSIMLAAVFISWRNKKKIQFTLQLLLPHLPIINTITKKIILIYFSQNLTILLTAGVPIADALTLLTTCTHSFLSPLIRRVQLEVTTGKQLYQAMQTQRYFPVMMLQLIKTGEESGTLTFMLTKIAHFYQLEVDHFLYKLEQLLEPLIMVVLGALIGGLVIALYLPIFNLGTTI